MARETHCRVMAHEVAQTQGLHGTRRELTVASCPLSSTQVTWPILTCAYGHMHTYKQVNKCKNCKSKEKSYPGGKNRAQLVECFPDMYEVLGSPNPSEVAYSSIPVRRDRNPKSSSLDNSESENSLH